MDIGNLLKNVNSLNQYISKTQDASEKCKNSRIQLNMSTVLALKEIRSLEVEYFYKCEENGIACTIFERLLCLPPSKTWGVLSKELVNLLQYWLDATRKHLVKHNTQWWTFMKLLLRFVKEISQKDKSLPNILVEHTTECLLDLATNSRPDATQRYEILHCFNMYCSESSREIRFALRTKLGQYFIKLSTYMASCGHLPTQYSIVETLLRWLLPRQDHSLRITSAAKWFPSALYADQVVNIFLERPWVNFYRDARDFLNAHNKRHDLITSVVCRKLTVGNAVIISGTERQEWWLDMNCASRSVTVLLDPQVLQTFGSSDHKSFETLALTHENTHRAQLTRESQQLVLSISTVTPLQVLPSRVSLGSDVSCDVTAVVSSHCDVKRLDDALRRIFDDKYEVLFDLDNGVELSPHKEAEHSNQNKDSVQQGARFSQPVEVPRPRRKRSGYVVKTHKTLVCLSPSTESTSSLAQLHEKLAALPRYEFDKEPVKISTHPELSNVTELSEVDDRQSQNTTLKFKPYGVCCKSFNTLESRKSQSDPETSRKARKERGFSPVVKDDTTSCLLVATIGSADDSVINDTVERLSKSKDYTGDNMVDLLLQEALQAEYDNKDESDSGINTGNKKSLDPHGNSETIDNTPQLDDKKIKKVQRKVPRVISSTSDESNTEAITETPCYVNTRRKKNYETKDSAPKKSFDEQEVEEFFTQHFTENKVGEVVVSPTLAKKINETSSETSDNFGENLNLIGQDLEEYIIPYDFNNTEVLECLNSMVDRVCNELDKYTQYLKKDNEITTDSKNTVQENIPLLDIINTIQDLGSKKKETPKKPDPKKKIKLKYKITPKKAKTRAAKGKKKLELESTPKMSTIIEDNALESAAENIANNVLNECKIPEKTEEKSKKDSLPKEAATNTSSMRRKRKLYSPKDEQITADSPHEPEDDTVLSELQKIKKTPKSTATCYKEIEKDRQKYSRMARTRKSRKPEPPSPRTKKMNDMFDKVKGSANSEKVTLADKTFEVDVYNFTSDSDDDFKEKKVKKISKRNSTTTIGSVESTVSKRGRTVKLINYTDKSSDGSTKVKPKVNRKPRTKSKVNIERSDLVDERMRKSKDVLNTSMVVEETKITINEPVLVLEIAPKIEVLNEKINEKPNSNQKKKGKKIKIETETKRSKRILNKAAVEEVKNFDDDRTESPLPGLLVEPDTVTKDEVNELTASMVDKFRKIYQEGPEYINESNTTQNLLSDVERINYSPPNADITEELIQIEDQFKDKDFQHKPKEIRVKKEKSNSLIKNTRKVNKTITPKKSNKEKVEVINISEITDVKSERSIATIGITGHGDFEEAPPSPKLLNENLEPRNLEVEYLDNSMKDYFDKLTKELNESISRDSNASGSNEGNVCKISTNAKSKDSIKSHSPTVSLKRLSLEDITRWLPLSRNSESDEESYASANKLNLKSQENAVKVSENLKSLKSKQDDNDSDVSEVNETDRKWLRLIFSKDSKSVQESNESKRKVRNTKPKNTPKIAEPMKNTRSQEHIAKKTKPRQSLISPIKLFDDLISNTDKQSETSLSDDEEYMKGIIDTLAKKKKTENLPKPKIVHHKALKETIEQKTSKSNDSLSSHSKISTSTKKDDSRIMLKRTSESDREDCKKKKVNNNVERALSGVTVSSVDDWFNRIEPKGSRTDVINDSVRNITQNVLEKLDTTLAEIHRNTSTKFAHMFIDVQKQLCEQKEARRGLFRQAACDIHSEIVKTLDEKFADLDKNYEEINSDFMRNLKLSATKLIQDECRHKRAMVGLLKQDVQAVADHMDKQSSM